MAAAKAEKSTDGSSVCEFEPIGKEQLLKVCWCKKCLLGKGAYASIYKGLWKKSTQASERIEVAVKFPQGPDHVNYEIATLKRAYGHPNILNYYAFINWGPSRLIVTELCNGDLYDLVKGSLTLDFGREDILFQIVQGVKYLHCNHILHRDLKPTNILYKKIIPTDGSRRLVMKLADFGCSRSFRRESEEDMTHYTRSRTVRSWCSKRFRPFGTDGWLAPEVMEDKKLELCFGIDIFPLGLIFAFTLCGSHPYGEHWKTRDRCKQPMLDIFRQRLVEEHGDECYALIDCMLDPNPGMRPTAFEIIEHTYFSRIHCKMFSLDQLEGCLDAFESTCKNKCIIGKGFSGVVIQGQFTMKETHYKVDVAIKKIHKNYQSEINILKNSKHENILPFCCAVPSDHDYIYVATVLCAGTLMDLITGKYQGPKVAESDDEILHQITCGLNYLHGCKPPIIHRDLKPENILISKPTEVESPKIKLADFGFSRTCSPDRSTEYLSNEKQGYSGNVKRPGSHGWRSPEIEGSTTFTKQSDIFPLALIFVITITRGRHAFDDYDPRKKQEKDVETMRKRIYRMYTKKEPMSLKKENFVDPRVYNLIADMLDYDHTKRPTTEEILQSLKNTNPPLDFTYVDVDELQEIDNKDLFALCRRKSLDSDAKKQLLELVKVSSANVSKALLLLCENNQSESLHESIKTLLGAGKEVDISVTDTITGNNAVMFLCQKCPPQQLLSTLELLHESPAVRKREEALKPKNRSNHDALQILCERRSEVPNWNEISKYL